MCALLIVCAVVLFKQKTAYEMRISDCSSDVCSSDLLHVRIAGRVIRANSGFPDGLVLDHSDNMTKLGLPTDILPTPLCTAKKGDRKAKERQDPLPKECSACNFLKPPKTKECPICHHVAEATSSLEEEDGELVKKIGRAQ